MAKHNIKEAARLAGINRATMYSYMKDGRISWETLPSGNRVIDTSELLRVFGSLVTDDTASTSEATTSQQTRHLATADPTREINTLQQRLGMLRQQLDQAEADKADLRRHVDSAEADKADLRRRLDAAEVDKADLRRRLDHAEQERQAITKLLTDQRQPPVPAPVSWWRLWRRRE